MVKGFYFYQFSAPIVSIWYEDTSKTKEEYLENKKLVNYLKPIDLFDDSQWGSSYTTSPSLYIGRYENQLYVQEKPNSENLLDQIPKNVQHKKYCLYQADGM